MECPRCGAGISHNDTQCWRCGESLGPAPRPKDPIHPQVKPPVGGITELRPKETAKVQSAVKPVRESYNLKERELRDREKELRDTMDALEEETKELEKAAEELENERMAIEEAKERIKEREDDLDAMAIVLENALRAAEEYHASAGTGGADKLKKLLDSKKELVPLLDSERQRIRSEIERELADQVARVAQLEAELKAVHEQMSEGEEAPQTPPVDVGEMVQRVTAQVKEQLGSAVPGGKDDPRLLTHIERLDQILAGGIPRGGVVLINGPAGSMKTTLTYNILHNNAVRNGTKAMYLCLEHDRESLIRQMAKLGMNRDDSLDDLMVVDLVDLRKSMQGQHGDWRSIIKRYVENVMSEAPFEVLALDSLESFMAMSEHKFTRLDIQDLFDWFRDLGLTTFVISETPLAKLEEEDHMELYVADGAIELALKEVSDSYVQRWIRCVKMRGANVDPKFYCLMHAGGSFMLSVPMMRANTESPAT
jgi:KaiC/GvpD/RAD55 family RecA-like ATPase